MPVLKITKEELKKRMDNGEPIVLLDVRSHDSYNGSKIKIKGASRKDPLAVDSWQGDLPRDKTIVAYCT